MSSVPDIEHRARTRAGLCALATLGTLSTAVACAAGFRFLDTGQNRWSFIMAIGFLLTATADVLMPVCVLQRRVTHGYTTRG